MNKSSETKNRAEDDFFLDITPETCPMTFVRTKLMIEKMPPGAVATVRLRGEEPLKNVPRSVGDMGIEVLELTPEEEGAAPDGIHRLVIRKP